MNALRQALRRILGRAARDRESPRLTAPVGEPVALTGPWRHGLALARAMAAHEGALEAGGPTLGVCGCGVLTALIRGSDGLAARVAEGGGLCSELAPTAPLSPQTLHARDRIIAGLSDAVIVVEARAEGGAVHTAKCALKEGRPVLVIEWPSGHPAGGNRQLLAEGAVALRPGDSVVAALRSASGDRKDGGLPS